MIVNNSFKEQIKINSSLSKTCSEHILGAFFNLKTATALAITALLMVSSIAHASLSEAAENDYQQKPSNINVPKDVQSQVKEEMENSLASIGFPIEDEYDPDRKPQNAAEAMAMVSAKISEAIAKSGFNYKWELPPPYIPDYKAFKKFQWCLFESLADLADQAQEPLFLENKKQFSVEIRPFVGHISDGTGNLLGFVVKPRYHGSSSYLSGQFLYGTAWNKTEVSGAFTYGHFFNEKFAGSITLVGGYDWAYFHRKDGRRSYRSDPKVWSIGLSPMFVYYLPAKVPLDLFLGADIAWSQRLAVEESSDGWIYPYAEQNDVLWRVKAGPSYTLKREGKSRLYQLKTSLAGNVQSQMTDRFTAAPDILFESQPLEGRGGYLFKLGLNLGSQKKSWQFAYGLRF